MECRWRGNTRGFKVTPAGESSSGFCRRSRGSSRAAGILRSGKVSGELALADIKHHDFIRGGAGAPFDIKLHRLAGGLVLLFDSLVVNQHRYGVLGFLRVRLAQGHLKRTHPLRCTGFLQWKFVLVSVS